MSGAARLTGVAALSRRRMRAATAAVLLLGACLVVSGVLALHTNKTVEIGGPLYQQVIEGKDVIADVLPPPNYILESYLLVLQMSQERNPARVRALSQTLESRMREYGERLSFW